MTEGLDVRTYGAVSPETAEVIAGLIGDPYERLALPPRARLEVRLVDTRERMAILGMEDKARYGIGTVGDEGFACAHDAFEDRPRITVCIEALGEAAGPALAALRHEVGHAVLHGWRAFYEVRMDAALRRAGAMRGLNEAGLLQLLFFIAVAVKDWEVSRLLLRRGFREDVRALAWELLAASEEDRTAWRLAEPAGSLRLLWAGSQLKPLLHAAPLRAPSREPDAAEVARRAAQMVHHLAAPAAQALLDMAWRIAAHLGDDTHANIRYAATEVLAAGF